ncbi:enoyl-CoA hydratase/isomerase family protein [Glaciibacter psychrotolerans]|uniref:2-(1,2-epoxy-1,2-dihydrophenyl)acetyl-CoA isomerase n=1 Tax=Glaciibacter psychrotolerans TaxID=670054 RepID=A0A7Z0J712_9MICO|nr:enoyl-CoA hydratase/isomerase family protein [Leifsonia psychrotolerans]NYJ20449.1 2-(1,2-epoxy-1,2-dihydrophenyl)acetyl-CoA isomerase [Leifsonia psychrotolerans]
MATKENEHGLPGAADEPILLEISDGLARITLNRPAKLNAFDVPMANAWADVVTEAVRHPDVRAILIAGNGRAFCAGGDVQSIASMPDGGAGVTFLAERINVGARALLESAIPVVLAAQGATAGGGLGILLSSDYVVLGERSRVGSRYANIGLTPDLAVTALLAAAVGERRALQLVLQDRLLSAQEAQEWGLAAEVVPDESVAERAEAIARSWIDGAAGAYGQAKRLIRSRPERSLAEQLAEEARTIGAAFEGPEAAERIAAFLGGARAT